MNEQELEREYKQAVIKLSRDVPKLIHALNEHSLKIERWIQLGR
jgi:hypothetical protein